MSRNSRQRDEQRRVLVARSAAQRAALLRDMEPCRPPLALADQALAALRYVRNHPAWLVGGVVLLVALRSSARARWLGRGWMAWQILSALRPGPRAANAKPAT